MSGAEVTAVASDFSAISLVFLVMMGGCAFGLALGYPAHWLLTAVVLFLFASGYVGGGMLLAALAITMRAVAPQLLRWLERLDIGPAKNRRADGFARYRQSSRRQSRSSQSNGQRSNDDARYNYDDMFGGRGAEAPSQPARPKGPTPESVLGVGARFSMKDLDAARRKLAKKFHPDLHRRASKTKQKHMAEKMRAVNHAYETLKAQAI